MLLTDTILALSSPPGPARRAILRLSGPHAWPAAAQLLPLLPQPLTPGWHGPLPLPLLHPTAKIAHALFFQSPRSFTGQDIAELHLPASPALLNAVSEKILSQNPAHIRPANPGEFSARAFFNGKIDLTQAEGIAATINAANESQLKAAASLRSGNLHRWIANLADRLAEILALLEANIDFVEEEDIHLIDAPLFLDRLSQLTTELQSQLDNSLRLDRLDSLPTVVFVGPPNVGKSSLINALTNSDRSITSPIAGTTRDTLSALLHTPAGDIRLLDVPGEESPTDDLRQKMMRTRQSAIDEADLIIEVVTHSPLPAAHTMTIHNKSDLLPTEKISPTWQYVSAKTGLHLDLLREEITTRLTHRPPLSAHLPALNQRHRTLLQQTLATLQTTSRLVSNSSLRSHPELLAADLRHSLDLLGQITGAISPDQIIGRIFSQFCIGK